MKKQLVKSSGEKKYLTLPKQNYISDEITNEGMDEIQNVS